MIEQLHCLQCEHDFTGTPATMVFQFTHHDCFQQLVKQEEQRCMNNHPTAHIKEVQQ